MWRSLAIFAILSFGALAADAQTCTIALSESLSGQSLTGAVTAGTTVTVLAKPTCDLDSITLTVQLNGSNVQTTTSPAGKVTSSAGATFTFASPAGSSGAQTYSAHASGNPFACQACALATGDATISFFFATGINPLTGSVFGTNPVTVNGVNFPGAGCTVTFGANQAASTNSNATQINVSAPPSTNAATGPVTVTVNCNGGAAGSAGSQNVGTYTYNQATITAISTPASGSAQGGNQVTFTGPDLAGCTQALFGSQTVPTAGTSLTTRTANAPPTFVVGTVQAALVCGGTPTNSFDYTYTQDLPTSTSITPALGPANGGTSVTITGTNFTSQCNVRFGGLVVVPDTLSPVPTAPTTSITVKTPPAPDPSAAASTVAVTVDCGGNVSIPVPNGFIYASITPTALPEKATALTLNSFFPSTSCTAPGVLRVSFGLQPGTGATLDSASHTITVTSPDLTPASIPDTSDVRIPVTVDCGAGTPSTSISVPIQRASFRYARANGGADAAVGEEITFTSTVGEILAADPATAVTSTSWDFGDGTGSGPTATHTYTTPGLHTVAQTVVFQDGSMSTVTRQVTVLPDAATRDSFTRRLLVPAQAALAGGNNSFFRSQMWLMNPLATPMVLRLSFVARDANSTGGAASVDAVAITIPPASALAYSDILPQLFSKTGGPAGGNVFVEALPGASALPRVLSRIYDDAGPSGTFGQSVPAFDLSSPEATGTSAFLSGLEHSADGSKGSRTNLFVVDLSDTDANVNIQLLAKDGSAIGSPGTYTVHARSFVQVSAGALGAPGDAPFSAAITSTNGAHIVAFASKLNNATNDPIFIPSWLKARKVQWIHPVTDVGIFKTSLLVAAPPSSPHSAGSSVGLTLTESHLVGLGDIETIPAIPDGGSSFYSDFINLAVHAQIGSVYYAKLTSAKPVVAWARAFSTEDSSKPDRTYGQLIPGFGIADGVNPSDTVPAQGAVLVGITQVRNQGAPAGYPAGYYTNVGFINVSDSAVAHFTVQLFGRGTDGTFAQLGTSFSQTLLPGAAAENPSSPSIINQVVRSKFGVTTGDVIDGYIRILPDPGSGDIIYGWASVNDEVSKDSIFVTPQPLAAPPPPQ
jgi:hypothetical protein